MTKAHKLDSNEYGEYIEGIFSDYPKKALHQIFEEQVLKTPDKIAVEDENGKITFNELNKKANQLGRMLKRYGINSQDVVAIMMEHSVNLIISILAILKVDAIYLPINIEHPLERKKYIIQNSKSKMMLVSQKNSFCEDLNIPFLCLTQIENESNESNIKSSFSPNNLACILYTSGTSGFPKGVMLKHSSFVNNLFWSANNYDISASDIILQKSIYTFDASAWEIFLMFITGAKLYILDQNKIKNMSYFLDIIEKEKITVCHFVPSMLNAFLNYVDHKKKHNKLRSLKKVFVGGEVLTPVLLEKYKTVIYNRFMANLYNRYGPTETTSHVTYYDCIKGTNNHEKIPIGYPIANTRIYILDDDKKICPVGEIGEIYISGEAVSAGYVNDFNLTSERFFPDPYWDNRIMYKSGDLGRLHPNAYVEFIGRVDNQVKIHGHRIELEEIEFHLNQVNGILQSAVIALEINETEKILEAFYTSDVTLKSKNISDYLSSKIPEYMIPAIFKRIESFVLTESGKIDKKRILDCIEKKTEDLSTEFFNTKELSDIQKRIFEVITENLDSKIDVVTLDTAFAGIGIDSITFIKIVIALEGEFDFEFDDEMLLITKYPTVKSMIEYVQSKI